ncbi:MAG: prephenate dehydrogenase/arogenate dehydrogenase family protein [Acidimicrobiia bacterium]|nr:prephenate dehydrogenase/arogenate dehydrogenase family protein [Acidimicrobiia bacterium]NNF09834.1 prephenate dehydrogenase/arogenate dehydrogenase family protein [Acidimicrobiia bacterium]NNL71087.1 prephenate dehydrogenase/arogenate dehydrogenase family protein [Acidimicrobiia bacterium]
MSNRVAVLGTGLIGTSVALGLADAGWTCVGWDPDPTVLEAVDGRGAFDELRESPDAAVADADVVILAGPPSSVPGLLAGLTTDALVTDVAGVKAGIVGAGPAPAHFVSGHPMAGREVSGPAAASASLFRGAAWIVITDDAADEDLARLENLARVLGAEPIRMTAAEHDDAVAVISHLPQVLAAALVGEATEHPAGVGLASGSFRDLTRVAASNPDLWAELLIRNGAPLAAVLEAYAARLHRWADAVRSGESETVNRSLRTASEVRRGMAPPVVAVAVALADQPGELAKVGHALERSSVDVRDLQLRHATYGGGGILTLSVRPGEAETLRTALLAEGLLLG